MKVAIMQPYFFPYLGYFNLIAACDVFISLDNVQYTRKGFINRNRILQPNGVYTFTVPLKSAPRDFSINQRTIAPEYESFKKKFMLQLASSYKKAPFFKETMDMIQSVLNSTEKILARICEQTILTVMERSGLQRKFLIASEIMNDDYDKKHKGCGKLIHLVKQAKCTHYLNAIGGIELYNQNDFSQRGIILSFVKPLLPHYPQGKREFVKSLSIIDVLMFNSPQNTLRLAKAFEIQN